MPSAALATEEPVADSTGEARDDPTAGQPSAEGAQGSHPRLGVRDRRERALQTLSFEAGGLLIVTPPYAWLTDSAGDESLALLVTISMIMMTWSALFNTAFDHIEHRATARVASDRPHRLRIVHTVLFEATAVLATWPVIVAFTGLDWPVALGVDLTLTLAYMVYGYFFHRVYDHVRPVGAGAGVGGVGVS